MIQFSPGNAVQMPTEGNIDGATITMEATDVNTRKTLKKFKLVLFDFFIYVKLLYVLVLRKQIERSQLLEEK